MTESYCGGKVEIVGSEWEEKLHGFIGEKDTDKIEHLAAIGRVVTAAPIAVLTGLRGVAAYAVLPAQRAVAEAALRKAGLPE
jgi:hypothetical protein